MSKAIIKLQFAVPAGHRQSDYARLHGNGGSGEIDWETPIDNKRYSLFPGGAGIYGWLQQPWLSTPWLRPYSQDCPGWLELPWLKTPWLQGTALITATVEVDDCGLYKFAFAAYDRAGNLHSGTPETATVSVHMPPAAPDGLRPKSYDKITNILLLEDAA